MKINLALQWAQSKGLTPFCPVSLAGFGVFQLSGVETPSNAGTPPDAPQTPETDDGEDFAIHTDEGVTGYVQRLPADADTVPLAVDLEDTDNSALAKAIIADAMRGSGPTTSPINPLQAVGRGDRQTEQRYSYQRVAITELPRSGVVQDGAQFVTYSPSGQPIYVDCRCGCEYALWVHCDCPGCGSSAVALVYDRPARPTMKLLKSLCEEATNGGTIYTARKTGFDGEIALRQYIGGSRNAEYFAGDVIEALQQLAYWMQHEGGR